MPESSGSDLDYLKAKRARLLEELHSDEHYQATETIAYGEHDPFDVPVSSCEVCGGSPRMVKVSEEPSRWQMQCGCGARAPQARKRPWEAALDWNMVNLSCSDYRDLPLFGLAPLSPSDAQARLVSIRSNLELRRKVTGLSRVIGQRTREIEVPGKKYQERLDAYLQWSLWGLRLVKYELKARA